ncbi:MAG: DUF4394 domain-containing protein [Amphiplicatus sp.]
MALKKFLFATAAALSLPLLAAAPANAALTGYSLNASGTQLIYFDPTNVGGAATIAISGDATRLDALDFRPANGDLVAYDSATDRYFTVNPLTGATTEISDNMVVPTQQSNVLDVDWNPTIDRMRLVTGQDDNIVFNPNDGSTTAVTDLFYAAGDVNEGANPTIVGNGYTNSFAGAVSTIQYVLDAGTDSLGILANNAGSITTVGQTTLNGQNFFFGTNGGLDIVYDNATQTNVAYAALFGGGLTSLFIVDLATGGLSKVGDFAGALGNIKGLTFADINEVPLPAALPLFLLGAGGLAFARRNRRPLSQ